MWKKIKSNQKWIRLFLIIFIIFELFGFCFFYLSGIKELMEGVSSFNLAIEKVSSRLPQVITLSRENLKRTLELLELTKEKRPLTGPVSSVDIPILLYHHIEIPSAKASKARRDLTVTPAMFEKQMKYLFDQGYRAISFEKLIKYFKFREKIPKKSLIITFDDGWKSQYQYAFPILKKYGFRATFFIVIGYLGGESFMDWPEVKELLDSEMEIGGHSMNHFNLCHLSEADLQYETQRCKIILEKNLNYPVNVFAYPYGAFNSKVIEMVQRSGFLAARSCLKGTLQNSQDIYKLRSLQASNDFEQFKGILKGE